jgi:hypothetical protein
VHPTDLDSELHLTTNEPQLPPLVLRIKGRVEE